MSINDVVSKGKVRKTGPPSKHYLLQVKPDVRAILCKDLNIAVNLADTSTGMEIVKLAYAAVQAGLTVNDAK